MFEFENLNKKLIGFVLKIIHFVYPLLGAKNLFEWTSKETLFWYCDGFFTCIDRFAMLYIFVIIILTGFHVPFLVYFKPLRSQFTRFLSMMITGEAIASTEMIILQIWLWFNLHKYKLPNRIPFIQLIEKLDKSDHDVILKLSKLISFLTGFGSLFWHELIAYNELQSSYTLGDLVASLFFLIGSFFFIKTGLNSLQILYTLTIAGLSVVSNQINELNETVEINFSVERITRQYDELTNSVSKLNSITKVLMMSSNMSIIPATSFLIFLMIKPFDGFILNFAKYTCGVAAAIYTVRGYMLIAAMSGLESELKALYSSLNSSIARKRYNDFNQVHRLKLIIEDISSPMSRVVLREFNSSITQMDTYNSIFSTASYVLLTFSFEEILMPFK